MSILCWTRRLAKRGLELAVSESSGDRWFAYVTPADIRLQDMRLPPLLGIGRHVSRDEAIRIAWRDFDRNLEAQRRAQIVLALGGRQPWLA